MDNLKWAKGMMEELEFSKYSRSWIDQFDEIFDKLAEGPMKGMSDQGIEIMALKVLILIDNMDCTWDLKFVGDEEEPRELKINLQLSYGS